MAALREIFIREREKFVMVTVTVLSIMLLSYYNFFNLESLLGRELALALYSAVGLVIYFILMVVDEWLVSLRIKVVPIQNHHLEYMPQPLEGHNYYAGLDIVIPKNWELTDCFVTLERFEAIYFENKVLRDKKLTEWFAEITKPEYKALRWKNPSAGYKINIGEGDGLNSETILVGKIVKAKAKDVHGKEDIINTLDFCLYNTKPFTVSFHQFGLYKLRLILYWRRNGIKGKKRLNGYLYSDGNYRIFVRLGDYNKDKDVPKPLLAKVEEVNEKPKIKEKSAIKGRKKKKSPPRKTS